MSYTLYGHEVSYNKTCCEPHQLIRYYQQDLSCDFGGMNVRIYCFDIKFLVLWDKNMRVNLAFGTNKMNESKNPNLMKKKKSDSKIINIMHY